MRLNKGFAKPLLLAQLALTLWITVCFPAWAFDASKVADGLYYNGTNLDDQLWTPLMLVRQGQLMDPFAFVGKNGVKALEGRGQTTMLEAVTPFLYGGCTTQAKLFSKPPLVAEVPTVYVSAFDGKDCPVKQRVAFENYRLPSQIRNPEAQYEYGQIGRAGADTDGNGLREVDCSALVYNAMRNAGYYLPDSNALSFTTRTLFTGDTLTQSAGENFASFTPEQVKEGGGELKPGDILLFKGVNGNTSQHTGIFYGYDGSGNPALDMEAVIRSAQLAGAHEFILQLPMGYDTLVGERGSRLSGGQRARIAIARALATNPRLLLLDEATAALDYESERAIHDNMAEICAGRTVFIVAHRLPTLRMAQRILVLDGGRLIETGAHAQLVANQGRYASLYRAHNVLEAA